MKKTLAIILAAAAVLSLISCGTPRKNDGGPDGSGAAATSRAPVKRSETTEAQTTEAPTTKEYEYAYAGYRPAYADVDIPDWRLLLVNGNFILPDDYEVKLAPAVASDPDGARLDYRAAPSYNEMYLAAKRDGIELTVVSGYRSVTRQRNNFNGKINKYLNEGYGKIEATQMAAKIILPPGASEHNAGLAADICSLYESFENSREYKWLDENAADYGFILRYPKDKRDVTGVTYEPWHWRFVGKENAKAIKASGLCLEEYLGAV